MRLASDQSHTILWYTCYCITFAHTVVGLGRFLSMFVYLPIRGSIYITTCPIYFKVFHKAKYVYYPGKNKA